MVSDEDLKKIRVRIVRHGTFYSLAKNSLELCKLAEKKLDSIQHSRTNSGLPQREEEQEMQSLSVPLLYEVDRNSIAAVCFSAFSVEAFIFDYGVLNLSKSYIEKYLDKLDIMAKWIIIPRLVNGERGLDPGCKALQELRNLVRLRNQIVHYKSSTRQLGTEIKPLLHFDDAERAVEVVPALVNELKLIDPEIDTSWLNDDMIYRFEHHSTDWSTRTIQT